MCRWNYMLSQEGDTKISSLFALVEPIWETTLCYYFTFLNEATDLIVLDLRQILLWL